MLDNIFDNVIADLRLRSKKAEYLTDPALWAKEVLGKTLWSKQQEIAKRIEESESVLRRDIKDWSPELESNLQQFAVSKLGFDVDDVKSSKADPRLYKLLHLAYVGNQIIQKQPAKPKIVQQAKPVTTLKSGGDKSLRNPKDMSQAEYAKWRRKGYA